MSSPSHEEYRNALMLWCREHAHETAIAEEIDLYKEAILVLWHLELEPARPILEACYAKSPRGGKPHDPIVMLRCLLLALLVGQPKLNKWVPQMRASRLLPVIAGIVVDERKPPGVGTYYDFLHRLHDGPIRRSCDHQEQPSELERRRSRSPKPKEEVPDKVPDDEAKLNVTQRLVRHLEAAEHQDNPKDLLDRLSTILLGVGVVGSLERGLLADLDALKVGGDGSPLRTGASGQGKRVCGCENRKCDCPRKFSDPDARWGYDHYRDVYFFGHHFYEWSTSAGEHDLPLSLYLDPANETDFTASLKCIDRLLKTIRFMNLPLKLAVAILDCGHDAKPIYQWLLDHEVTPVMPLSKDAPAHHPWRLDVTLSKRGVPMCEAGVEMAPWGSAGPGRKVFVCPVKAGWLDMCPQTTVNDPQWVCRPELKMGPTVSVKVSDNPRLFPPIPRNSDRHTELMRLRSGTERSNAVKKETFQLEAARHRRASFWLIRLHLIALLQHGKAWVAKEEASALVAELLWGSEQKAA